MNKQIVEQAARIAKGLLPKCKDCGGDGVIDKSGIGIEQCLSKDIIPCPTCARLREIAEWHWNLENQKRFVNPLVCDKCGWPHENPTFDIPALRQLLEDLREWWGFLWTVFEKLWPGYDAIVADVLKGNPDKVLFSFITNFADILTDSTLLAEAVLEFLKEVK